MHQLVGEFERLIGTGVTHRCIAAPLASGTDGITVYLVWEYAAADSLDVLIRDRGTVAPDDAVRIATELADAIDFAARRGVRHGTLHPRDILVSADETRLTGLGVGQALETVGVAAPVRRPYAAPERVAGAAWDGRADVFSLAALVYEMLWARRLTAVGGEAAQALTDLPGADLEALRAAFTRALAAEPTERFATARAFSDALEQAFPTAVRKSQQSSAHTSRPTEPRLPLDEPGPVQVFPLELPPSAETTSPAHADSATFDLRASELPDSAREPSAWPVLPVAAALVVGALGFSAGYLVGAKRHPERAAASASAAGEPARLDPRAATKSTVEPVSFRTNAPVAVGFGTTAGSAGARAQSKAEPAAVEGSRPKSAGSMSARRASRRGPSTTAHGPAGAVKVDSRPSGAKVFIDGKLVGTTPISMARTGAGEHAVRLERDGYRQWSTSVRVAAGGRTRVTASLER